MAKWIDTDTGAAVEEMTPKPRRGRPTNEERAARAAAEAAANRSQMEQAGTFVPAGREDYPAPIEEPPNHSIDELEMLEAAVEIFEGAASPKDLADLKNLADDLEKMLRGANEREATRTDQPRGRIMTDRKTLHEKLCEVMAAIDAVEKHGRNEAQSYNYVRATDVTAAVRPLFIERGLVFTTSIRNTRTTMIERPNRVPNILVEIDVDFSVGDGREVITFGGSGMGIDAGDKGVYKAITGALKYGLRTLLLIPDERMDPEVQRQDEREPLEPLSTNGPINISPSNAPGVTQGGRQSAATSAQITAIKNAASKLMLSPEALEQSIVSVLGDGPRLDPALPPNEAVRQIIEFLSNLSFIECGKVAKALVEAAANANGGA